MARVAPLIEPAWAEIRAEIAALDPRALVRLEALKDAMSGGRPRRLMLPAGAMELHRLSFDPDATFERVAALAVGDPTVTARLMAFASSALYTAPAPRSLKDALARVGLEGVRHVAFDVAYSARLLRRGVHADIVDRSIRHARTASALARLLAREVGLHPGVAGLAGLLHALGAIWIVDELNARAVGEQVSTRIVILLLRRLHGWASAGAAREHGIDEEVVAALSAHHAIAKPTKIAGLLSLADSLAPGEPGARARSVESAIQASGLPLAPAAVMDRLRPLLATFDDALEVRRRELQQR